MTVYTAPPENMHFVLRTLPAREQWQSLSGNEELGEDVLRSVLEQVARFCEQTLLPLNQPGEEQGCHLHDGEVRTPEGFKEAYGRFATGGWTSLAGNPGYGGQGLPELVSLLVFEMQRACNLAFGMYPGLTQGACNAIDAHASADLKQTWLPPMLSGRFSGTMCLTEPQCGTDLGLVRTRAKPAADGMYLLSGTKIFISAGEHDLCENIVHLVLARLPDAPLGIRGLSLFLVPKFQPVDGCDNGKRNRVHCARLERKMGIRASATCEMVFDDAVGWLVGTPHKGMRAMFTMMNAARLAVGIQGVAVAESAYQNAVAYAREREQGRALSGARAPLRPADPILVHADVRRMLLCMRAWTEGGRALAMWVASSLDVSKRHCDLEVRRTADDFVSLLTPVLKAYLTDLGSESANLAVQVWGGHGYIRDNGIEQLVRDARICQIYEGTNGVQAMDLIARKLPAHAGRYLRAFFHPARIWLDERAGDAGAAEFVAPLAKAFGRLQAATSRVAEVGFARPDAAAAVATDYLRLFGLVAMGLCWARMAEAAAAGVAVGDDGGFYRAKLETARFFTARLLPQSGALVASVMAGDAGLAAFDDAAFWH